MIKTLLSYIPQFRTEYFIVLDDPKDPKSAHKVSQRVKGPEEISPEQAAVRITYFDLFGYYIGLRAFYRSAKN